MTAVDPRTQISAEDMRNPALTRIYVARYSHYPDVASSRDIARLKELVATLRAISDAGLALVEADDGR